MGGVEAKRVEGDVCLQALLPVWVMGDPWKLTEAGNQHDLLFQTGSQHWDQCRSPSLTGCKPAAKT